MKKYTEYEKLTPLEVAEIGERDGWPVKGLAVSNDGFNWDGLRIVHAYLLGDATPVCADGSHRWKYCARPIDRIEWELDDTVEDDEGNLGTIDYIEPDCYEIKTPCGRGEWVARCEELKPWKPGYGYTEDGKLITPLEGYKIVPEGESLPYTGKLFQHGAWHEYKLDGNEQNNFAQLKFDVRAYARKIEPEEQTAYNWFRQVLPRKVANRIINKVSAHELERKYKSAANALWNSFDWDDTPESADYWCDWHMWLNGDIQEMPKIHPPIAEGRNSAGATSKETPKAGQVWRHDKASGHYLIVNDSDAGERFCGNRQWNLTDNKPAWFISSDLRYGGIKVADSLDEYYGTKV